MLIESIRLQNFRCHADSNYSFDKATFIEGENGSGKTSVVEAVYLLLNLKSFKEPSPKSVTGFGKEFLRIEAEYFSEDDSGSLIYFFDDVRTLKKNGVCVLDIPDYLTSNPVFCYSPDTSTILAKEQKIRRNFIDRLCFYRERAHIFDLRYFNRLVAQKTAELQKQRPDIDYIETVNEKLTEVCDKISLRRKSAAGMINSKLEAMYAGFGGEDEFFTLDYVTNTGDTEIMRKEASAGKCLYGVHRDRFYSRNTGRIYDKFSSYGQKKTFELLVLAAILLDVEEMLKTDIITLLDDFEAGLDEKRSAAFFSMFSGKRQVIMTGVKNRIFSDIRTIRL
ncbi:DNA replication/repair protein RecF [Geovibrio thiophilus]|uniref:DNA replication and repair protein RecF n=1 Tax=Geovibrio thiophilus TaxID=139438 RepID=A0A3R5UW48_9BACT|nr:AAA family ATPase [Geovibrio thiophilus]QAR31974.1 DNA replication/repair protein RecF [Geovibrio thiophilus]